VGGNDIIEVSLMDDTLNEGFKFKWGLLDLKALVLFSDRLLKVPSSQSLLHSSLL
jgi:hypothetical protein